MATQQTEAAPGPVASSRPSWPLSAEEIEARKGQGRALEDEIKKREAEISSAQGRAAEVKELLASSELGQELAELTDGIKAGRSVLSGMLGALRALAEEVNTGRTFDPNRSVPGTVPPASTAAKGSAKDRTVPIEGVFEDMPPALPGQSVSSLLLPSKGKGGKGKRGRS